MVLGGTFVCNSRFGGRFDRYKQSCPDRREMGGKVRKKIVSWDYAPGEDYFKELFRVSKEQIIWGGNYFSLPPNRCFLVWRKTNIPERFTMAMAEYAWCSMNDNAKVFDFTSAGIAGRFHPTQKPEELYRWIYRNYTQPGYKILDTHLGSGSSRRAAYTLIDSSNRPIELCVFDQSENYLQEVGYCTEDCELDGFAEELWKEENDVETD